MNARIGVLMSLLVAGVSLAEEPAKVDAGAVEQQLQSRVLAPLRKFETRKRRLPSRDAPVPTARKIRLTDEVASTDAAHRPFVSFAIDSVYGTYVEKGEIIGCYYPDTQEAFVDYGEKEVYPAAIMLGKMAEATPDRCRAAGTVTAQK